MSITPNTHPDPRVPWIHRCEDDPDCRWLVGVKTPEPAKHKCPWYGGPTHFGWTITVTLVTKMWARLDSIMDEIALLPKTERPVVLGDDPGEDDQKYIDSLVFEANLKGKARGMAEMIAIFMDPHFTDANQVAREAKRRAEARARQDTEYETRGLGQHRYAPPPTDFDKYKVEPKKAGPKLPVSDEDAAQIRKVYGAFPEDILCKTYKITPAQLKQIAESPEPALQS